MAGRMEVSAVSHFPFHLMLMHISSSGLLVGACVNRAPEGTFGAAVAEVGVLDLLKFADFTIGKAWCGDYGDPHDPKDFDFIYPISPLHNVPTDRVLPPTILLTADRAWACSFRVPCPVSSLDLSMSVGEMGWAGDEGEKLTT